MLSHRAPIQLCRVASVQSNSQRQVAAAAAKLGMVVSSRLYHGRLQAPTPEYKSSGNAFLNRLFGAHLHDVAWTGDRNTAIRDLVGALESAGRKPYFVPYGVSNDVGAIGYATAIVEIAAHAAAQGFTPAAIVHSSGSAGNASRSCGRLPRSPCRKRALSA
jgi:L-cysteate sulfo-lyase